MSKPYYEYIAIRCARLANYKYGPFLSSTDLIMYTREWVKIYQVPKQLRLDSIMLTFIKYMKRYPNETEEKIIKTFSK